VTELIVAVDGPGGTGKSTVSRVVAQRLELPHLDTGAFYRAATLVALRMGADLDDAGAIEKAIVGRSFNQSEGRMFVDGEDVSEPIRGESITTHVSQISAYPKVREFLVDLQRNWVADQESRAVVDGRDIGSVVFPDATLKIYLDARPEIRARRRALQRGEDVAAVEEDLERRDRLDSSRTASPLMVADDAVVIDTSEMTLDQVVDRIVSMVGSISA
jgi:cytidylate kinase